MGKSESSVLQILRLMSLEDVRQMTASHQVQKAVNLPMAAGAEGFSQWEPPHQEKPKKPDKTSPEAEGRVLPFSRSGPALAPPMEEPAGDEVNLLHQRELFRQREEFLQKKEGVKLYKQTTEAHIYRAPKEKGSKLKFAHTNGVLINKKQD